MESPPIAVTVDNDGGVGNSRGGSGGDGTAGSRSDDDDGCWWRKQEVKCSGFPERRGGGLSLIHI